jgi:hypothetical protein
MSVAKINDGDPAFPGLNATLVDIDSDGQKCHETQPLCGMTLRDFFAAAALQGMSASGHFTLKEDIRRIAFERADAMLKARSA